MSIRTRRKLTALALGVGVLMASGCVNGDYHGQAYYNSGTSAGYVHYGSGCGNDYGALIFLGILGGIALFQEIFRCH